MPLLAVQGVLGWLSRYKFAAVAFVESIKSSMKRGLLLTFVGVFAAFGLSLPISNLFVQRTSLVSDEDQEFKAVSDTFVKKCAD